MSLETFLNRLEREVRAGTLTLEQAYEAAFRRIKPAQAPYRPAMKPALEMLQAWYEQRALEFGAAVCFLPAPTAPKRRRKPRASPATRPVAKPAAAA